MRIDVLLHNVTSQYVYFKALESFAACCDELVLFVDGSGKMSEGIVVPSDG